MRHLIEGLHDERVRRALRLAVRDQSIRRRYRRLRREGVLVDEAVRQIAEQHHLSAERIRTIIYRKGERR